MKLRFTTSLPDLMEGRVIDVSDDATPDSHPDIFEWLRAGILKPVPIDEWSEVALAPVAVEHAIARRGRRSPRTRTRKAVAVTADECP